MSSGGTAEFTIYNYGYADDSYDVLPQCNGIAISCQGREYRYASAYSTTTANIAFSVSQQSGTGTVGADISSTGLGGYDIEASETVYGQPALVIDSAQTPVYGADQNISRCAASCFTSTASISTVPFYTLGQARGVTLVYNQDLAHPQPFIYATVSPAADGPAVSGYLMSATLNGGAVTFTNGETALHFLSPGSVPVRLGGQVTLAPGGPAIYTLVVNVVVQYATGGTSSLSYTTILPVYDASNSPIAHGWTIAGIDKLDCAWEQGCLTYGGDGSMTVFTGAFPYYKGSDSSSMYYSSVVSGYVRTYVDGHKAYYNLDGYLFAVTDLYDRATNITYDGSGRVIQISDPERSAGHNVPYIQLAYGAWGLASITETGGPGPSRITTVGVDPNRYLDYVTDPDGNSTSVLYYGVNLPIGEIIDRRGGATYFSHDNYLKLSAVVAPAISVDAGNGGTTSATPTTYYTAWQGIGVPTTPTASAPPVAAIASDITATVQAPGNRITQFSVNAWGQPTTTVDPSGQQTVVTYSNNNNSGKDPISVDHPDFSKDTFAYDGLHRVVMSQPAGDSATYYHYNVASQVDSAWGQAVPATGYHYNANNTLASMSDASGVSMSYTYNGWKEVVTATDNAGHTTTYGYDALFMNQDTVTANQDTVTAPGHRQTTSTMDVYGRVSTVSAPLRATVTTSYDLMNRPYQVSEAGRPATTFGYDPLFRTDVTDANGNVTHTDYNALGWPVARRDANNATEAFRYDIAGRMTSWTNRRGDLMSYTYDARDRILSRSGRGVYDHYSYSPDSPNGNIMVAWNAVERDSLFQQSVVGNHLGADSTVTWVNGVRYRVLHGHVGALSTPYTMTATASSGVSFRNRSTALDGTTGLVASINDGFNTASAGYNNEALPNSLYNPVSGTRSANYMSLHAPSETYFSDATLENTFGRRNRYDLLGRLDRLSNLGAANQHAYYYDQYGELSGDAIYADCSGSNVTADEGANFATCQYNAGQVSYSYDNVGNRIDLGATYYAGNRLGNFNGGFLRYDADGNVTQKYGVQPNPHNQLFYWNAESRLDSVSYDGYITTRYEYNALGKPVKKYRQGALDRVWLWDGEQLLAEFDGNNARLADYQYSGTDQPYAYTYGASSPAGVRYPEQNALGNVMGTHEGTSVTQTITYDAWGVPSYTGQLDSRLMWKGLMWEGDVVGLYYMRGRWYDPELGRFIQEDPIHSGVNDYVFAGDDPINGSDPSGLDDGPPDLGRLWIIGEQGREWQFSFETLLEELGGSGSGSGSYGSIGGGSGGSTAAPAQPKPKPKSKSQVCAVPATPSGVDINQNIRNAENHGLQVLWFYNEVRNHGPWDYKQNGSSYADFGNFNFGATGYAVGFRQWVLLRGAGWAQMQAGTSTPQWGKWWTSAPYGDDPADQAQIQHGVQYYKAVKSGQCSH